MPASFSYTLLVPPPATAGGAGAGSGVAPELPCPTTALTQQELLDLFDRLFTGNYIDGLKSPGPGYELYQGLAALGARLSLAVERLGCGAQILSSDGGGYATATVELSRATAHPDGITVVVKAGTVVKSSKAGRQFKTLSDVTFGPADLGPFQVDVQAVAKGYEWNELGHALAASGEDLPGEIDTVDKLVEVPDFGDTTIQVAQTAAQGTGGADAFLDEHGADRGITRIPGENDGEYKVRIRTMPDTISPDAVQRTLERMLLQYGASFAIIETWDVEYQTCWDAPTEVIGGSNFDPTCFVFDDPRPTLPFRNRWMDESESRGCFIVLVQALATITEYGVAFDDTAMTVHDHQSAIGARAPAAFDVPSSLGFGYLQGAFDGFDLRRRAVYKSINDTLQAIKAAGVVAVVELRGA